ncbi:MAG: DUF1848 domain-containing protein [Solobacterium sp.]|nr:DUF1848 domain-containing protein [Solobacterium sp.]
MILNTGSRTDIPAFFSKWMANRLKEGFVLVRNPYNPSQLIRYEIDPAVVDLISFCTKNPKPMLDYLSLLDPFHQLWQVTLTSYGKDIEPNVPDKHEVIKTVQELSKSVGKKAVIWRYDPIFLSERYSMEYHFRAFSTIASSLNGYTEKVVISFLDLYEKTKRNFPEGTEVSWEDQVLLTKQLVKTAAENGMKVYTCHEKEALGQYGADTGGCTSQAVIEEAIGFQLNVPRIPNAREGCPCLLGSDIGAYNTCMHFCRYCYANYDRKTVLDNIKKHDPDSPLLIGNVLPEDHVVYAKQKSWKSVLMTLDL